MKKNILVLSVGIVCIGVVLVGLRLQSCSNMAGGAIPPGMGLVIVGGNNSRSISAQEKAGARFEYWFNGEKSSSNSKVLEIGSRVDIRVVAYAADGGQLAVGNAVIEKVLAGNNRVDVVLYEDRGVYCFDIEEEFILYATDYALRKKIVEVAIANELVSGFADRKDANTSTSPLFEVMLSETIGKDDFLGKLEAAGVKTNFISSMYTLIEKRENGLIFRIFGEPVHIKDFASLIGAELKKNGIETNVLDSEGGSVLVYEEGKVVPFSDIQRIFEQKSVNCEVFDVENKRGIAGIVSMDGKYIIYYLMP